MKAIVLEMHNHKSIKYTYVDSPKCHDDSEAVYQNDFYPPIMVVKEILEDGSISQTPIELYTTPEVAKDYTGFDLFDSLESNVHYRFVRNSLRFYAIEFCIERGEYPYLHVKAQSKDYVIKPVVEYPTSINKICFDIF